ncbi:ribonuclease M5 [Peribacillus sp. SCS-26]|uniref:ribonuclease M5 n=1 Tax=Paraperibacillus marinus TaxID=3115295 RepID=UPI003906B2B2
MKIQEIIVVEGKDDTVAVKRAVEADTIETNGSAVDESVIERIRLARSTRGVIIFTDPDFPGEKIRHTITEQVPGCKHAFLEKAEARPRNGRGIGVEHASPEAIRAALKDAYQTNVEHDPEISQQDLLDAGLMGGAGAKERRERIGRILKIGYTNGKQLQKRLQMFRISRDAFLEALQRMEQEGNHE